MLSVDYIIRMYQPHISPLWARDVCIYCVLQHDQTFHKKEFLCSINNMGYTGQQNQVQITSCDQICMQTLFA